MQWNTLNVAAIQTYKLPNKSYENVLILLGTQK